MRFKERVVLITGAVRGIGWGIAQRFAGEGARVVINDIEEDLLTNRSQVLSKQGFDACGIRADVSKGAEVEAMIGEILHRFGTLDVLVNNAAIFNGSKLILDIEEEDWDRVMAVNLKGVFNCSKAAARHMLKKREGRIVNLSSLIGKTGRVIFGDPGTPSWASYAASKAGIIALTKSMAFEWAPFNVYVNAVAPSYIETEKTTPDQAERVAPRVPLGKIGTPDDVASAVLFLASDEASYITGEILDVNGGVMMD
jgi:3-oxoacyl-[acyl-carrier protein] reductase